MRIWARSDYLAFFCACVTPEIFRYNMVVRAILLMTVHCPIGFRPRPAEARAFERAQLELGINRTTLVRTAVRDWLANEQRKGVLTTGTASAFQL